MHLHSHSPIRVPVHRGNRDDIVFIRNLFHLYHHLRGDSCRHWESHYNPHRLPQLPVRRGLHYWPQWLFSPTINQWRRNRHSDESCTWNLHSQARPHCGVSAHTRNVYRNRDIGPDDHSHYTVRSDHRHPAYLRLSQQWRYSTDNPSLRMRRFFFVHG